MALIVVLVLSLVCQCWTAPHRRYWTPQAMLYLKGAQGHRSTVERRSNADAIPNVMYSESNAHELKIPPRIFNLQRMTEQGEIDPYDYLNYSL
ncbi:spexin-like [Periophthalmus magnuspinnatus]|uniref:spexin-like n=1 Tax=Periophthalmus magnuspinnatus TaxID=409849 RepID=UPI002436392E|nr:spexin-like [Periophthalmus magnuspinnatus]